MPSFSERLRRIPLYALLIKRLPRLLTRKAIYLGDHRALTGTIFGQRLIVDTRDLSLAPRLLTDGFWELPITRLLLRVIRPGMTVVEVGANVGYYSTLLGHRIGPAGRLYAFEANPAVARMLDENLDLNGLLERCTAIGKAAGAAAGRLDLHCLARHHGGTNLAGFSPEALAKYQDTVERVQVEMVAIDQELAGRCAHVDLVRVDAEGSEPGIFAGMAGLIAASPRVRIITEFSPPMIRAGGRDPGELLDWFVTRGFRLALITDLGAVAAATREQLLALQFSDLYLVRGP